MFLCVSFPVKVSQFTMFFFFLACKKVEYDTKCFSSTTHVISTSTKEKCATLINDK